MYYTLEIYMKYLPEFGFKKFTVKAAPTSKRQS